jgi:hypothetical protein
MNKTTPASEQRTQTYEEIGYNAKNTQGISKPVTKQRAWYFINKQKKKIKDLGKSTRGVLELPANRKGVMSVKEYAARQGFSISKVYYAIKKKRVKYIKEKNNFFIDTNE